MSPFQVKSNGGSNLRHLILHLRMTLFDHHAHVSKFVVFHLIVIFLLIHVVGWILALVVVQVAQIIETVDWLGDADLRKILANRQLQLCFRLSQVGAGGFFDYVHSLGLFIQRVV